MNLPITTLEEAWGPIKNMSKVKQNRFRNESYQSNLLADYKYLDNTHAHNHEKYQNNNDINNNQDRISPPINKNIENIHEPVKAYNSIVDQSDSIHITNRESMINHESISITNSEVIQYLSKFNEEYKTRLINRVLKNYISNSRIETFVENKEFEMFIVVALLIYLLYQKILSLM